MEKYSLVYIDDKPEAALTKFLDKEFRSPIMRLNAQK